jgi:hypothetical protein
MQRWREIQKEVSTMYAIVKASKILGVPIAVEKTDPKLVSLIDTPYLPIMLGLFEVHQVHQVRSPKPYERRFGKRYLRLARKSRKLK